MLPWQARCLLPLLLRKLDRAGVLDVVQGEEAAALSAMLQVPAEVVEVGLAALIGRAVFVLDGGRLLMPNFLEAQECSQSDKIRKQVSREKAAQPFTPSQLVTDGHRPSHPVTPSRAVPCLAEPSLKDLAGKPAEPKAPKFPKPSKPPDPEHQATIDALTEAFAQIRGAKYGFHGSDAKAIPVLRALGDRAEIVQRWRRALDLTHPPVSAIHELPRAWNRCGGTGPPSHRPKTQSADPNQLFPTGDLLASTP
jgi:hypothetical protein